MLVPLLSEGIQDDAIDFQNVFHHSRNVRTIHQHARMLFSLLCLMDTSKLFYFLFLPIYVVFNFYSVYASFDFIYIPLKTKKPFITSPIILVIDQTRSRLQLNDANHGFALLRIIDKPEFYLLWLVLLFCVQVKSIKSKLNNICSQQ